MVADANVSQQAAFHQLPHARHRRAWRKHGARPVLLVQVDPIDSQPPGAGARLRRDLNRKPDREKLGGEEHLVATTANRLTDDALGLPERIDLSGIDQRHPKVQRAMHDLYRLAARVLRPVSPLAGAELPGAEPDRRHSGAADLDVLQESPLSRRS